MGELSEDEYRALHRQLGGHPDNFIEWLARHREWEAQRLAQPPKPPINPRPRPKRGKLDRVAQKKNPQNGTREP